MTESERGKRKVLALRLMFKNAKSIKEVENVKRLSEKNKVKFHLLSMDDDTFRRAMSDEFNQVEQFLIK